MELLVISGTVLVFLAFVVVGFYRPRERGGRDE